MRLSSGRQPGCDASFPGYQSRFGDGHPNRRQCTTTARSTGQRCRCDAMQGSTRCRAHGGHVGAYRSALREMGPRMISTVPSRSIARKMLARIAATEPFPPDAEWHPSPVERGRVILDALNRS